jgi:hypothetical protein
MVLTYDAYNETIEQKQESDKQIQALMKKHEEMEEKFQMILSKIDVSRLS